jgi:ketosteroid isomerase-like protein
MEDALNAGDVDAAMAFFTDDAVVKLVPALPPGSPDTYTGAEEIRAWFEELAAMNFEIHIEVLQVEGDTVTTRTSTWVDSTREMGVAPLVATEVYTVLDGKIKGFTWTISDESLAKIQAALPPPPSLTVEYLIGIWKPSARVYLQFNLEDGTYRVTDSIDFSEDDIGEEGQFRLEGTLITFTCADDAPSPWAGQSATYQVELTEQGQLQFVVQEDPNSMRKGSLQRSPWSRVSS